MSDSSEKKPLSIWQIITSILAAMMGVQSSKNRARDFTQGNLSAFIVVGIIMVFLFVLGLIGIVKWVLST